MENRADPEYRGRIQVRIHGRHFGDVRDDNNGIGYPTEDLPWAMCAVDLHEYSGSVPVPQIREGTLVFGIALDGETMNELICLGGLAGPEDPIGLFTGSVGSISRMTHKNVDVSANSKSTNSGYDKELTVEDNALRCLEEMHKDDGNLVPQWYKNIIKSMELNDAEKFSNWKKSLGIGEDLNVDNALANEHISNLIGQSLYKTLLKTCNDDPLMAMIAFEEGGQSFVNGSDGLLSKTQYDMSEEGMGGKGDISRFYKLADYVDENLKNKDLANKIRGFINFMGEEHLVGGEYYVSTDAKGSDSIEDNDSVELKINQSKKTTTYMSSGGSSSSGDYSYNYTQVISAKEIKDNPINSGDNSWTSKEKILDEVFTKISKEEFDKLPTNEKISLIAKTTGEMASKTGAGYSYGSKGQNNKMDCSGFANTVLKELGLQTNGGTSTMVSELSQKGFTNENKSNATIGDILKNPDKYLKEGDIVVCPGNHVEIYSGNGQFSGARATADPKVGNMDIALQTKFWGNGRTPYIMRANG